MDQFAVGLEVGSKIRVLGGELEEPEAGGGVQAEPVEYGVKEVVGKAEAKAPEGVESTEDEEAGDAVEELGPGELGLVTELPAEDAGRVDGSDQAEQVRGKVPEHLGGIIMVSQSDRA